MNAARVAVEQEPEPRLSISSVDTELAGSNRSGKQRLLPDQAEDSGAADTSAGLLPDQAETSGREAADISADHTASRGLSETIAGTQVAQVVVGGDQSRPPDRGEVH